MEQKLLEGKCVLIRVEIIHMLKFKAETVEKNLSSTVQVFRSVIEKSSI